jgi:hypothetical protein
MNWLFRLSEQPLFAWLFKKRFMKFATVGASGEIGRAHV